MTDTAERFTVPAAALRAVAPHVSVDNTRGGLQGILLESDTARQCVVGCDGHSMAAYRTGIIGLAADVILRADWRKLKPCVGDVTGVRTERDRWELRGANKKGEPIVWVAEEIVGPYPDWRRIVPKLTVRTPSLDYCLAPALLARFIGEDFCGNTYGRIRMAMHESGRAITVYPHTEGTDAPTCVGVAMPCRLDAPLGMPPVWA